MHVATDVGGTFTDFVVLDGDVRAFKVPTGATPDQGVLAGLEDLEPTAFHHASTVAANALIESSTDVALVTTQGFRDVLAIQTQARRDLYDLTAAKPDVPVPGRLRFEIEERVDARGGIRVPVDPDDLEDLTRDLASVDVDAVAVCTLFAHLEPANERRIADHLRSEGYVVSASHEVGPEAREYPRTVTTVADAQVKGPVDAYLDRIEQTVGDVPFHVLRSDGGVVPPDVFRQAPVRGILSGPVGGVAAAQTLAESMDLDRVLTLDMGGTSADLSRIGPDGPEVAPELVFEDLPIRVPVVDVHTLGAGGGSIARLDPGGALRVGPGSAGSDPGPACYGRGGTEATVTDADVLAGWVAPDRFPEGIDLDVGRARSVVDALAEEAGMDIDRAVRGIQRVVETNMAHGARRVTLEQGHDPRRHTLIAYGGAGPLHAWAVADELGIGRVAVPPLPGVFSAYGLTAADRRIEEVRGVRPTTDLDALEDPIRAAHDAATDRAADLDGDAEVRLALDLRYVGQGHALTVPVEDPDGAAERFHDLHERRRGHAHPGRDVEAVGIRVTCTVPRTPPPLPVPEGGPAPTAATRDVLWPDGRTKTAIFDREDLPVGWERAGPVVVHDPGSTCAVPPGWTVRVHRTGSLVLEVV